MPYKFKEWLQQFNRYTSCIIRTVKVTNITRSNNGNSKLIDAIEHIYGPHRAFEDAVATLGVILAITD